MGRNKRSFVWDYFKVAAVKPNDQKCTLCAYVCTRTKTTSTSSRSYHSKKDNHDNNINYLHCYKDAPRSHSILKLLGFYCYFKCIAFFNCTLKELSLYLKLCNFLILISLQPSAVHLRYFKLVILLT